MEKESWEYWHDDYYDWLEGKGIYEDDEEEEEENAY